MRWAENPTGRITYEQIESLFGDLGNIEQIDGIHDKVRQFFTYIQQFTENEAPEVSNNCDNGIEAWRRIVSVTTPAQLAVCEIC